MAHDSNHDFFLLQSHTGIEFFNKQVTPLNELAATDGRLILPYHPRGAFENIVKLTKTSIYKELEGFETDWNRFTFNKTLDSLQSRLPNWIVSTTTALVTSLLSRVKTSNHAYIT